MSENFRFLTQSIIYSVETLTLNQNTVEMPTVKTKNVDKLFYFI